MTTDTIKYSPQKLEEFKELLHKKLKETQEQIEDKTTAVEKRKVLVAQSNLGFSEGSRHFQQQAKKEQRIRRLRYKESELKAALRRVEDGTYGICENTGQLIREARLRALPTARFDIIQE